MLTKKKKYTWRIAMWRLGWLLAGLAFTAIAFAAQPPMEPDDFVKKVFNGEPPFERKLWLRREHREILRDILDHSRSRLRVPHWSRKERRVFILDEIGKTKPITIGVVVVEGRVERVSILIYRESRGGEVSSKSFVDQYAGVRLNSERLLDKRIDGITGATRSVNAVTRATRAALYLDSLLEELEK